MSNFYEEMSKTQNNVSVTENGMTGYKTTNHALVDFNFGVSSYRRDLKKGLNQFTKVLNEQEQYVLKYLFYLRDAREGIGERKLFRECIKQLLKANISNKKEVIDVLLSQTPEYGRWDDLWLFLNTEHWGKVIKIIKDTLRKDFENYHNGKPISLLAKWLPSANASNRETKRLATLITRALRTTPRTYRKTLSTLRHYLDVTEVKTCANEWDQIDYNKVPSKANLKYKDAFLKHDEERRREFLSKALSGDESVKVNMGVAFPHEIVRNYVIGYNSQIDQSLEAYWKNLKPCVGLKDTIVVRDGSASMSCRVGGSNTSALHISTALAIYCSQYLEGSFKDKFITFSSEAKLIDLSGCGSLKSKLETTYKENECSNTNIQNVFELILNTAVEAHIASEELPSTVLIISDMEFDPAFNDEHGWRGMNGGSNVFKVMDQKFKAAGYKLPKLAFWNVNSRTMAIPCIYNENGVLLISGFSQNVLSMVMNGETDPYQALIKELDKERYQEIPFVSFVDGSESAHVSVSKNSKHMQTPSFLK